MLSILPKAAELYRRQIVLGLDGDPRAALKARVALRELFVGGRVELQLEPDGSLWAVGQIQPDALLRQAVGNGGSGGVLTCAGPAQGDELNIWWVRSETKDTKVPFRAADPGHRLDRLGLKLFADK